jgi:coenzyme F420-reducing hydrogenase beta subunit
VIKILDFIRLKNDCTGCSACVAVCPVNCITMKYDKEGFLYPHLEKEKCINCHKCSDVCPIESNKTHNNTNIKQFTIVGIHRDDEIWQKSSSGGAFSAICDAYCDNKTIIFGAVFDGMFVKHDYVIGKNNISVFRKSKYVQSSMGSCFSKVKGFLDENYRVLFSGTPCQIAGLKSYLGREYEKLLCVDFICYGVGSPKVFEDWLVHLSKKYNSKIVSYTFRIKNISMGNLDTYFSAYCFKNGNEIKKDRDLYILSYLNGLCHRRSCASCRFAHRYRLSDITIADYKKTTYFSPEYKEERNMSRIIFNTENGSRLKNTLDKYMIVFSDSISEIEKYNPQFYKNTQEDSDRDLFFEEYINGVDIGILFKKYNSPKNKNIKSFISKYIPYKIKCKLKHVHK